MDIRERLKLIPYETTSWFDFNYCFYIDIWSITFIWLISNKKERIA